MLAILGIYGTVVYLVFIRFRWLPLNVVTNTLIVLVGVVLFLGIFTALRLLTPVTTQAATMTRIVEIAPQVSGRVDKVLIERNVVVEAGAPLFTIDPTLYQSRVDALLAQLSLSKLRLQQYEQLAATNAASRARVQQAQAEAAQLEAQLTGARFDLANTTVRAPSKGMAARVFLKEGYQVSPSRTVLTFMGASEGFVGGLFQQSALQNIKLGDRATISFPALPGRVFESEVVIIPSAIGDTQLMVSGQLPNVSQMQTARVYPVYVKIPEDFPANLFKVGLAATVYIHTENAGAFSKVASALQWLSSSISILI
jgi:RND family efflux transporter MFP subunit